ncbi:MAG: hypothetical protein CM1200mP29_06480 [Verrucomicrobiota bacterium]|nr:MAG: hypothetical protein CM1200mP29_06480 [Verrucomicrobiota bacterium]
MIFGLIGLFRGFFPHVDRRIRYLSDASYGCTLSICPVMLLQIWVAEWPWPSGVKFLGICAVSTAALLLVYE